MNKALLASLAALVLPATSVVADSLLVDTVEPTGGNVIVQNKHSTGTTANPDSVGGRDTFTTVFPAATASNGVGYRGQSFTMPDNPIQDNWDLNAITFRADNSAQDFSTGGPQTMKFWLFEWNPNSDANSGTNWTAGDGVSTDSDPFDGTGITNILVNGDSFDVTRSFNGDYLHFNLTDVHLKKNTAYGALVSFENNTVGFKLDDVRDTNGATGGEPYAFGGILRADATTQSVRANNDDLVFYVDAYAPEPTAAAMFGIGSLAMLSRRRRRA